jgi:hypothetical protein
MEGIGNGSRSDDDGEEGNKIEVEMSWYSFLEDSLASWAEQAQGYRLMHEKAYSHYNKISFKLTIPAIILSTLTGVANFGQESLAPYLGPSAPLYIGALSIGAAILSTIAKYVRADEKAETHRNAMINWDKLYRTIATELTQPRRFRTHAQDFLTAYREERHRLSEQSPTIPYQIRNWFSQEFKADYDTGVISKPNILSINNVEVYRHGTGHSKHTHMPPPPPPPPPPTPTRVSKLSNTGHSKEGTPQPTRQSPTLMNSRNASPPFGNFLSSSRRSPSQGHNVVISSAPNPAVLLPTTALPASFFNLKPKAAQAVQRVGNVVAEELQRAMDEGDKAARSGPVAVGIRQRASSISDQLVVIEREAIEKQAAAHREGEQEAREAEGDRDRNGGDQVEVEGTRVEKEEEEEEENRDGPIVRRPVSSESSDV